MIKSLKHMLQVAAFAVRCSRRRPGVCRRALPGIWYDHTGRGAVEIVKCGSNLCGKLVWLKNASHKEGCGLQILGDVKPVSNGVWDGGWIIDPEKDLNTKYSVELTLVNPKSLKVVGYLGTKFFSETMMWKRAPGRPQALRRLSGALGSSVLGPCGCVRGPPVLVAPRKDVERPAEAQCG